MIAPRSDATPRRGQRNKKSLKSKTVKATNDDHGGGSGPGDNEAAKPRGKGKSTILEVLPQRLTRESKKWPS